MSLFEELKRRNVVRVGIAYAVSAWVLLQMVDIIGEILELPAWGGKMILAALVIGFFVALIFAWVFELTPEGLKKETEIDRSQSITHSTGRKLDFVIMALMAGVGLAYAALYGLVLLAIFVGIGTLLAKLAPGETTDLLIDLPSLRVPRMDNVLRKSVTKVWHFMKEVTIFFVAGALLISILEITGALAWITQAAVPLTAGWLGLPAEAATAFVMGFVRRDFGATGFFSMSLTPEQLLVAMVTITLFVPCIASVMVILKERGWAYVVGLGFASVGVAFLVGGLLARLLGVV